MGIKVNEDHPNIPKLRSKISAGFRALYGLPDAVLDGDYPVGVDGCSYRVVNGCIITVVARPKDHYGKVEKDQG